jgi:hypothetical protein
MHDALISNELEPGVLNKSLTVVLPVYNGETRLRKSVHEILELASELTPKFGVLIIDDGSSDSTFEVAEDLAANYPQVSVRRHRNRRGLGPTIDYVQRRVRSDAVILHDGTTPINAGEMRSLWQQWIGQSGITASPVAQGTMKNGARALAGVSSVHAALERAHRPIVGFQMITPVEGDDAADGNGQARPAVQPTRANSEPMNSRGDLGRIPPLPRPKFLSALANFALGE